MSFRSISCRSDRVPAPKGAIAARPSQAYSWSPLSSARPEQEGRARDCCPVVALSARKGAAQAECEQAAGHSREAGRQSKDGETIGRGSAIGSEDARRCIRFPVYCRPAPGWRNGRRGGLKNRYRKVCGFDSRSGHHLFDSPANSKAPPIAAPLAGIGSARRKRAGSAFSALRPAELAREGLAPTEGRCGNPAPGTIFASPPREHEPPSRPLAGIAPMEPRHLSQPSPPPPPGALAARLRPASVSRETPL